MVQCKWLFVHIIVEGIGFIAAAFFLLPLISDDCDKPMSLLAMTFDDGGGSTATLYWQLDVQRICRVDSDDNFEASLEWTDCEDNFDQVNENAETELDASFCKSGLFLSK